MSQKIESRRRLAVAALRRGASLHSVAHQFDLSVCTAHRWFHRAQQGLRSGCVASTDRRRALRMKRSPL